MLSSRSIGRARLAVALATVCAMSNVAAAAPPFEYLGERSGPGGTFDVLPDGRLIGMSGESVLIETSLGSGVFEVAGFFDPGLISEFGASFISLAPDGSRFVVGDGNFGGASVYEVALNDLNGGSIQHRTFRHENFAGAWYDENRLAISAADPGTFLGEVRVLDLGSGQSTRLLSLDGASAGVSFDHQGNLFTGNGFDLLPGGSETGDIRAFLASDIAEILSGQRSAFDFADSGQFIGRVLSAGGLGIDASGHLFIGGGDFNIGEFNYFALADAAAVARAFSGGEPLNMNDLYRDDPDLDPFSFYGARFNAITSEWLIASGSSLTLHRYAEIPAPGALMLLGVGIGLVAAGRGRRRR